MKRYIVIVLIALVSAGCSLTTSITIDKQKQPKATFVAPPCPQKQPPLYLP